VNAHNDGSTTFNPGATDMQNAKLTFAFLCLLAVAAAIRVDKFL
jgi:hypothetical protein